LTLAPAPDAQDSQALQKRLIPLVVVGLVGTASASILTKIAIEIGADTIKNLGEWNDVSFSVLSVPLNSYFQCAGLLM